MNCDPHYLRASKRLAEAGRVFCEAIMVTVLGATVAFVANALSPRGLTLSRNYFPSGTNSLSAATMADIAGTNQAPAVVISVLRVNEKGLQFVDSNSVALLFHDPRVASDRVIFMDARDEERYKEGHVPGAYEFDPYHPEKYLATVLSVCLAAEQIVVYCTGSDCEDSQFAALTLRDAGIANQKLFVYAGGITEWTTNGLPLEIGGRQSGNLRNPAK